MEAIAYAFYYIIPYIAVVVFFGGIIYQISRWRQVGVPPVRMSLFPRPEGRLARLLDALVDMFTLKGLWKVNKPLWIGSFIMHLGLLLLLTGHIRVFNDLDFVWNLLNWSPEQVDQFSKVAGITAGLLKVTQHLF